MFIKGHPTKVGPIGHVKPIEYQGGDAIGFWYRNAVCCMVIGAQAPQVVEGRHQHNDMRRPERRLKNIVIGIPEFRKGTNGGDPKNEEGWCTPCRREAGPAEHTPSIMLMWSWRHYLRMWRSRSTRR